MNDLLSRDVAALLRLPAGRDACRQLAAAGKKYGQEAEKYATRPVVRAAVAKLAERLARQQRPTQPEAGRFARLAEERLLDRTLEAVLAAADYRVAKNGHTDTVRFGAPGVTADTDKDWNVYRGSFKGWAATTSEHHFMVPRDWLESVDARGLACVDGLLTLDARPVPGKGCELYKAVWAEQGRGTALNTVHGYIARSADGATFHGKTAVAAIAGLRRKSSNAPRRQPLLNLDRLLRRIGGVEVTFADSARVGNCESGTRSWCQAVGIDPDQPTTMAAVIAGYRLRPLAEALKVIRYVVRTQRTRRRKPVDLLAVQLNASAAAGDELAAAVLRDYQEETGAAV